MMLYWLDLFGVFVFAVSGALVAEKRGMDIFGFIVVALFTAVGGGTMRDIALDLPVFWIQNEVYLLVILAAALSAWVADHLFERAQKLMVWADAVGLSVFCAAGAAKTYTVTGSPAIAVAMGIVTAVFGGMVRDVICNEIPLVLRQDIYATAAFTGSLVFVGCRHFELVPLGLDLWIGVAACFAVRASAVIWGWSLPARTPPGAGRSD